MAAQKDFWNQFGKNNYRILISNEFIFLLDEVGHDHAFAFDGEIISSMMLTLVGFCDAVSPAVLILVDFCIVVSPIVVSPKKRLLRVYRPRSFASVSVVFF